MNNLYAHSSYKDQQSDVVKYSNRSGQTNLELIFKNRLYGAGVQADIGQIRTGPNR